MAFFQRVMTPTDSAETEYGRCERIRTSDPFLPKEVRYQAALHTDIANARRAIIPEMRR